MEIYLIQNTFDSENVEEDSFRFLVLILPYLYTGWSNLLRIDDPQKYDQHLATFENRNWRYVNHNASWIKLVEKEFFIS